MVDVADLPDFSFTKKEILLAVKDGPDYIARHYDSLVTITTMLSKLTVSDVDKMLVSAFSGGPTAPSHAWRALAWMRLFGDNTIYVNEARLLDIIATSAQALYSYSIVVKRKPCVDVYAKLFSKDEVIASSYRSYCLNFAYPEGRELLGMW